MIGSLGNHDVVRASSVARNYTTDKSKCDINIGFTLVPAAPILICRLVRVGFAHLAQLFIRSSTVLGGGYSPRS